MQEIKKALRERPHIVRSFIYQGRTLLSCAAGEGREDVVELLLRMGARPNGPSDRCSPLMSGISSENPDVVRVLLDHGASPFLPHQPFGFTPYEMGMKCGNEQIVELLRQAKVRRAKELDRDERTTQNLDNAHGDD
ncbi:MAG: ankyrin repeat domain-containing protein [Planctomycetota bacterium]